jgi:class 3 adenylate cyclase/tetratricopeptide (TPR) repeat protein
MQCTQCKSENPDGSKFCGSCGSPLNRICASCGASNAPTFKFCSSCGKSLESSVQPASSIPVSSSPHVKNEAERRHLTVMFCDVVGSTALSERLDAEEYRRLIMDYGAVCEKVINYYKGHIAQYLGDGILVYFGYPNAMEGAPVLGVQCGLAIVEAIVQANLQWQQESKPTVDVRIGLHTGLTVVDDHLAMGETCNVAARIQDKAEKNTVIISADAYKLVKGWFETESKGEHILKGLSRPLEIYWVKGESGARSQMDFRMADDLTPLIGREKELNILYQTWDETKNKNDKVVFISGEPGMGKSRLVYDLKEYARNNGNPLVIECNCSANFNNSAFHPIVNMLHDSILKIKRKDSAVEKLKKIEQYLFQFNFNPDENVPLLASILSIPLAGSIFSSIEQSAETQKQKSMELLISILLKQIEYREADRKELASGALIIFEDIHWADPSTLEFINLIVNLSPQYRILIILTVRPGFNYNWGHLDHIVPISLSNLNIDESKNIISNITKGKTLPQEVLKQIIDKTDGIPLFIEELTKMVLESGLVIEENNRYILSGPLPPLAIPTTLQDSLKARLDRFISSKEVVYYASVIGKDFSYELLESCCPLEKNKLQEYLKELVHSGLLIQKGFASNAQYRFRHSLMQNAAYESILRSRRLQLHQRIATVLTEKFPEIIADQPELLAHHFSEAGLNEQAIPYWQQASEKALRASAYIEALHHIDQGLKMVSTMPQGDKRIQYELAFQVRNSTVIKIQDGWSSDKVKKAYDRCFELCKGLGESEELFTTLFGIWAYYLIGGNINQSYEIALGCMERTEQLKNPAIKMQANVMLGNSLFWLARYDEAITYLEQVFTIYEESNENLILIGFGQDTRVVTCMILCWCQVMKGNLEKAYLINQDSLKLVSELHHPFSEAIARCTACWFFQFTRDVENTFHQAQLAIDLGFPAYQCWGYMLKGWAIAAEGKCKQGIEEIKSGYQLFKDQGCGIETYPAVLLAEAYIMDGDYTRASIHIELGLKAVENNKEMVFEPELLRLKGIVNSLQKGDLSISKDIIQKAIKVADKSSNELFSFRAALSLQKISDSNGADSQEFLDILESKKSSIDVVGFEKFLKREKTFA